MKIARIDEGIKTCEEHLRTSGASGTEIEAFLTRYLTIVMCASFEEHIEELVNSRAAESQDVALASFVRSSLHQVFRSVKTGEIAGLLGRFGEDHKTRFQDEMSNNERVATFYNNIVENRHQTTHGGGFNLTFRELVDFYSEAQLVLDAVARALQG